MLAGGVGVMPEVDPQHPSAARIYDFLLGGPHHFIADRQAAAAAMAVMPEMPDAVRANRDFLRRAVIAAAEAGIEQFLDLGSGIPFADNVHELARRVRPEARVVYVDLDPVAVAHGRQLVAGDPRAAVLAADILAADEVLAAEPVRDLIDFSQPVCLLVVAVADFIPDSGKLGAALKRYRTAVAPGSLLAVSHGSGTAETERSEQVRRIYNSTTSPLVARGPEEVRALLGDWPVVEPGLCGPAVWRPDDRTMVGALADRCLLVGMAEKPFVPRSGK